MSSPSLSQEETMQTVQSQTSEFSEILQKKSSWTPIKPQSTTVKGNADEFMSRALALRVLEIPVGEFIESATKKDLPVDDVGMQLLKENVHDEEVHDKALNNLAQAFSNLKPEDEEEAKTILNAWYELDDHPISIAKTIESGVFFPILTMMRYVGDISSRQVSADISKDETLHVDTNWRICKKLGIEKPEKKTDRLRRRTVAWLFEPIQNKEVVESLQEVLGEAQQKFSDFTFWMTQSDKLSNQGIAPGLNQTRNTRVLSFFEVAKIHQPTYESETE